MHILLYGHQKTLIKTSQTLRLSSSATQRKKKNQQLLNNIENKSISFHLMHDNIDTYIQTYIFDCYEIISHHPIVSSANIIKT